DALAVGEIAERRDRIDLLRVDDRLGAELASQRQPFGGDVDRDHARAHRAAEQGGAEPDRPLAEDRQGVAARHVEPLQRAARGAHAARLVAGYDGPAAAAEAQGRGRVADRAIGMEIAPAHPRGLHGDDDLAGSRRRVGEFTQLELPATEENDATHIENLLKYLELQWHMLHIAAYDGKT